MRKLSAIAGSVFAAVVAIVSLAPSAWAMLPQPEPAGVTPGQTSPGVDGMAIWQVVLIAAVAVGIGAVGTYVAQRTHRHSDARSVSVA